MSTIEISEPKNTHDGLSYQVTSHQLTLAVEVRLIAEMQWGVRIKLNGFEGGLANEPREAFKLAAELFKSSNPLEASQLNWSELEEKLAEADAFNTDPWIPISFNEAAKLGINARFPDAFDVELVERCFRNGRVLHQLWGVRPESWHVTEAKWVEGSFGREIQVRVHLGKQRAQ